MVGIHSRSVKMAGGVRRVQGEDVLVSTIRKGGELGFRPGKGHAVYIRSSDTQKEHKPLHYDLQ